MTSFVESKEYKFSNTENDVFGLVKKVMKSFVSFLTNTESIMQLLLCFHLRLDNHRVCF